MARQSEASASALVGLIYEAAYDGTRWLDVVRGFKAAFDGARACIVRIDRDRLDAVVSLADPELADPQLRDAFASDPLSRASMAVPVGRLYRRNLLIDETAFRRRRLWRDWFMRRDMYHAATCNIFAAGDVQWALHVTRGRSQEPLSESEFSRLGLFMPHVMRAGAIGQRIAKAASDAQAFSRLPFGRILVDGEGRVIEINEAAEAMLAGQGRPLALRGGRLHAADPKSAHRLSRLVAEACAAPDGVMPGTGGAMMLAPGGGGAGSGTAGSGARAGLALSVAPFFGPEAFGLSARRCAAVLLTQPMPRASEGFRTHLRAYFGLTPAEARLAARLAEGATLKDAAGEAAVTVKTARTYLDRIFAKTGTHQQSELVAMLATIQPLSGAAG